MAAVDGTVVKAERTRRTLAASLDILIARQRAMQDVIGPTEQAQGLGSGLADSVRLNCLAAVDELMEVLGEVGWKPWKTEGYNEFKDRTRYVQEIADVVLFVMNLLLAANVNGEELLEVLEEKWRINADRQREGY